MWWEYLLVFGVIAFAILIVSRRLSQQASGHDDCHCGTGACLDENGKKVECLSGTDEDGNCSGCESAEAKTDA
jgi:hypothetical protein